MLANRKREIRIKADTMRAKCRVGRYGVIDLFMECESLGYKLLRYPLEEGADLGFVTRRDSDIVIITNSSSRLSREIFTLAHELGHAVLHLENEEAFVDSHSTISDKCMDEREQEANYFAACLLMPNDNVNRFIDLEVPNFDNAGLTAMDIARIMSEFSVNFEMALNRLESLEIIDSNTKLLLDSEKNEMRVYNLLRSVGGNAKLNFASTAIDLPHEYLDYVIYNYNHNAVPQETLERVLACYQLSLEDVSDKLVKHNDEEDDLEELIRGLDI